MVKVLVIPDTHLKPKMFDLADKIMRENEVDYAVQLGDNFDDFYCYEEDYRRHYERMEKFREDHPETVWLWGNHEASYILDRPVTGNMYCGIKCAERYVGEFKPKFVHLDGRVIFSHAGIFQEFVERMKLGEEEPVGMARKINGMGVEVFWKDDSPLWARYEHDGLARTDVLKEYVQVVGHTPEREVRIDGDIISVDVFSTSWGRRVASEKMVVIDTETGEVQEAKINFRKVFGEGR